jgi:hypothetical protein
MRAINSAKLLEIIAPGVTRWVEGKKRVETEDAGTDKAYHSYIA